MDEINTNEKQANHETPDTQDPKGDTMSGSAKDTPDDTSNKDETAQQTTNKQPDQLEEEGQEKPLSKNQIRKRKRLERLMNSKRIRKQQKKEAKAAKALAEGRDVEAERQEVEKRRLAGDGYRKREAIWNERYKTAGETFKVCLDCGYEENMTKKEISSLAIQVRYCYASNKRARKPCQFSVSNLSGETRTHLENVAGFPEQWESRGFTCSDKTLTELHPDASKLIYLTSDSEHTLEEMDDTKIYVIGGIVDRNRLKGATMQRAQSLGLKTAKLPISSYVSLAATKVLTCNHVFEILVKYRENGKDWKGAMMDVLPQRKEIASKEHDECEDNNDTKSTIASS